MRYRFANFELDTERLEFTADGEIRALEPQVFDLLRHLVENAGRLIGRDELIEVVWRGRIVSDGTVSARISMAGKTVGDSGVRQAFIKTVPRRGFRFINTVFAADQAPNEESASLPNSALQSEPPSDKPSIAILPFDNLSSDPEQVYFVDGVVEDILTTLSRLPALFVISRKSSFTYKGKVVDVRDIGRELGVRYVLEGSIRKAGSQIRVTAQLVDCSDGRHLWADHYDGEIGEVFAMQDRLTQEIVTALEIKLTDGERVGIWRERSGSPLVYEKYIKGRDLYQNFARQTHNQTRRELEEALTINPAYTAALVQLGWALADQARFGWVPDRDAAYEAALAIADRALAADPGYGEIYSVICYVRSFQLRFDEAIEAAEKAVLLSPNSADVFHLSGMSHIYAGNFAIGRNYERQSIRLCPIAREFAVVDLARAEFHLASYDEAQKLAAQVLATRPHWLTAQTILLASLWRLGRREKAVKIGASITETTPGFSVARWSRGFPYRRTADLQTLMQPLRQAGLAD